jgi:hypothetical protein
MNATKNLNGKKLNKDELIAFTYYGKIKSNSNGSNICVYDVDHKREFFVNGKDLIESAMSADQHDEEEKIAKTKVAEILINAHNRPLSVCFEKADGTERILRGRLVASEPLLGRSKVEDLDIKDKNRIRLVDHRTLRWLILDGKKYVVK